MLITCRQGIQWHQNCGVGRCGGGLAAGESMPVEQRTTLFIKGWDVGVEASSAVKLWRLSGGWWAGCQPPPMPGVQNSCLVKEIWKKWIFCPQKKQQIWHRCMSQPLESLFVPPRSRCSQEQEPGIWPTATHLQAQQCQGEHLGQEVAD